MGRFDSRATQARGAADLLRWKLWDPLRGKGGADKTAFEPPQRSPDLARIESRTPALTWIGHASFLVTVGQTHIVTDPVLGESLGGVVRRFGKPGLSLAQLPPVDVVLLSHNHRDHLDLKSIEMLGPGPTYVAPLGHERILRGAGAQKIVELDWWQTTRVGEVEVTLTPARHWSARLPWDRNDALWGGFFVRSPDGSVFHSGDTAWFDGFAEIRARLGAPDWALLPIGAYAPRWFMSSQHMDPSEAVSAFEALGAQTFVAMHWGTFQLTDEPLAEPPRLLREAWATRNWAQERLWILDIGETRALRSQ